MFFEGELEFVVECLPAKDPEACAVYKLTFYHIPYFKMPAKPE